MEIQVMLLLFIEREPTARITITGRFIAGRVITGRLLLLNLRKK
jgi:hypothetical protein